MFPDHPHRRRNMLTGEWVLVSPHRARRPWQGQMETVAEAAGVSYDPGCYLCPGNERAGGHRNPAYESTFVFDNDFAALLEETESPVRTNGLLEARSETGLCRVVCFTPDHSLTLSRMSVDAIANVVDTWTAQYLEIGSRPDVASVQIFENRGAMMGASNPHPHGQIWATSFIPDALDREIVRQREHRASHNRCLLCDYLAEEIQRAERIVCSNDSFVTVVPFWAVWPFETLVLPRRHVHSLPRLESGERRDLAAILRDVTSRYDRLFQAPFPYTMGFHQLPTTGRDDPAFHLHAHFYPPLLRSATVRKFMVGFEMLATPQRDITPESAAERLASL